MTVQFSPADEGKCVVSADGKRLGEVDRIEGPHIFVRPDHSLSRHTRRRLGWNGDEGAITLDYIAISEITDDEIKLVQNPLK